MWREYLRIRVTIDVSKSLKRNMKIKKVNQKESWINFKYERLPNFCLFCRDNWACGKNLRQIIPISRQKCATFIRNLASGADAPAIWRSKSAVEEIFRRPRQLSGPFLYKELGRRRKGELYSWVRRVSYTVEWEVGEVLGGLPWQGCISSGETRNYINGERNLVENQNTLNHI
ncbi:hypothetical protein LguiB_024728 [Lonicera macranthoides]